MKRCMKDKIIDIVYDDGEKIEIVAEFPNADAAIKYLHQHVGT